MKKEIKKLIVNLWNTSPKDYKRETACIDHAPSCIPEEGSIIKPLRLKWHRKYMDGINNLYIWKF